MDQLVRTEVLKQNVFAVYFAKDYADQCSDP